MSGDRLDWILATDNDLRAMAARYDEWAETYDDDHDSWGWEGPDIVARTRQSLLADHPEAPTGPLLDAGCGTGRAARALRLAGCSDRIVGLDLSNQMLRRAGSLSLYHGLVLGSLYHLPLPDRSVAGVVSTGVFTHGHVSAHAFSELCRVTKVGGLISITQRLDVVEDYRPMAEQLAADGVWRAVGETDAVALHPDRDQARQRVATWQVLDA